MKSGSYCPTVVTFCSEVCRDTVAISNVLETGVIQRAIFSSNLHSFIGYRFEMLMHPAYTAVLWWRAWRSLWVKTNWSK